MEKSGMSTSKDTSINNSTTVAESLADQLRCALATAMPLLSELSDEHVTLRPVPDQWSPKEIIGHLIDSASNNHDRFVLAQIRTEYIFRGYEQNQWVAVQQYNERTWDELLRLWEALNLHLAHVMAAMSEHDLVRKIRYATTPEKPMTVEFLLNDYVGHLEHHLTQILPEYQRISTGYR